MRSFRSLHDTTNFEPSQHHDALSGMSGSSNCNNGSPIPTFQTTILLSAPANNSTNEIKQRPTGVTQVSAIELWLNFTNADIV